MKVGEIWHYKEYEHDEEERYLVHKIRLIKHHAAGYDGEDWYGGDCWEYESVDGEINISPDGKPSILAAKYIYDNYTKVSE